MALSSPGIIKGANDVLVKVAPAVAMIKQFAYDCSGDVANYGTKVQVPVVGAATEAFGLTELNPGTSSAYTPNYEHSTGTVTAAFVTLDAQPKVTFTLANNEKLELVNDTIWSKMGEAGAKAIGDAVQKKVGAQITSTLTGTTKTYANFTSASTDSAKRAILAGYRAECGGNPSDYVLAVKPAFFADILALFDSAIYGGTEAVRSGVIEGLYGFKAVVCLPEFGANVNGALIPTNGIAVAVRPVAVGDEGCYSEYGTVTDDNGFSITAMRHGSAATGSAWVNVTALVGATLIDTVNTKKIA